MNINIKIVYFANLIPNSWEPIITEQLDSLKKLELYNKASNIYMSVIANDRELIKLKELINSKYKKIELKNIFKENYYEYPGIKTLYQIAQDNDDEIILYFHSKGITSNQHENRKYLFNHTIENYNLYLQEFKRNKELEVAGIFPNVDGFCYFNFFWTRSSYVRNYCSRPEISENRYIWEVWIGIEFSRKKEVITFSPLVGYTKLKNSNEIWNADKIYREKIKQYTKRINQDKVNTQVLKNQDDLIKSYEFNSDSILDSDINKRVDIINEEKKVIVNKNVKVINEKVVRNNSIPKPTRIYDIKDIENLNKPKKISKKEITTPEQITKPIEDKHKSELKIIQQNKKEDQNESNNNAESVVIKNAESVVIKNAESVVIKNTEPVVIKNTEPIIKSKEVLFKASKKLDEFLNKYKNTKKIFVDLSYEKNVIEYKEKYKKIITLSPINAQHNITSISQKLVQIKKNKDEITLKELLFNNVYKLGESISNIYCNMEGGEDGILEDLFHHCFINKINLLLKINFDLHNFKYLLSYFNYDKNILNVGNYVLFEPKNVLNLQVVKKNMTILIIGYNQYTYISSMVSQLKKYTNDIVVIDNNSTYEPLLNYYKYEYNYSLLRMDKNYGHKVYEEKLLSGIFGNIYIITDPDLEFNKKIPSNFIENLVKISNNYKAGRVGFAIEISSPEIRSELTYAGMPLKLWESRFWQMKIKDNTYELYNAPIDTTFCLINTIYNHLGLSIRVAGNYTCKHLPWYINFHEKLLDDEYTKYLENNISTNFWEDKFKLTRKDNINKITEKVNINWIKDKIKFNELLVLGENNLEDSFNKLFKDIYNYKNINTVKKKIINDKNKINTEKTIKEIIFDIFNKKTSLNLSLIYCNCYGEEESFIEDLLYICYINKIKLLIKFNYDKWQDKSLAKFENLIKLFSIYEGNNLYDYNVINNNLLFFKENDNICKDVFKKNMTVVIISFNQYTYVKKMVEQVEKYTNDIVILDNQSTFPELLKYYEKEYKYTLIRMDKNYGHKVYEKNFMNSLIGDIYLLTDPDLKFNEKLPKNFIQEMINISNYHEAEKVGFALLIDSNDIRNNITSFGKSIKDFEKQYWVCKFYYPNHELYSAAIDTTFCLVNKQNKGGHYRIAGDYICKHLPWHKDFDKELVKGEYEFYIKNNISTNYWKK